MSTHSTRVSERSHRITSPSPHPPPHSTPPSPSSPTTTLPPLSSIHQRLASDPWNGDFWCYEQIDAVRFEGELTLQKIQWIRQVFEIIRLNLADQAREVEKRARELGAKAARSRSQRSREVREGREEVEGLGRELAEKVEIGEGSQRVG